MLPPKHKYYFAFTNPLIRKSCGISIAPPQKNAGALVATEYRSLDITKTEQVGSQVIKRLGVRFQP